jgi:hypothetical protein
MATRNEERRTTERVTVPDGGSPMDTGALGDGPTRIDPIPPPPLATTEAPKKRGRGRPPGVKNGEGKGSAAAAAPKKAIPVFDLDDLKKELAQAGALAVAFTRDEKGNAAGTFGEIVDTLDWHRKVKVQTAEGAQDAIAPSEKLERACALMGPYLAESGTLELVQLGPEAKFAIGAAILVGPTVLAGFGALWAWAMHPKKASAQVVPMKPSQTAEGKK